MHIITNNGLMFIGAIVIASNGACTYIHSCADRAIAYITQMIHFAGLTHLAIFDFNKITDMNTFRKNCAWPNTCEGSNDAMVRNVCAFNNTIGLDFNVFTQSSIFNNRIWADGASFTYADISF